MHVNIPKYRRGKASQNQNKDKHKKQGEGVVDMDRMEIAPNRAAHSTAVNRTYGEAVAPHTEKTGQRRISGTHLAEYGGSHSSLILDIPKGDKTCYTDAWVGRMKKPEIFKRLEDEVSWTLGPGVSPKYLGDDMILLLGLSDEKAAEIISEETNQGSTLFYSLVKWSSELRPGNRLVWLRCWGIPLVAWKLENIRKIVATVGDLVEVDDDVEHMQRLDQVRVLVRTPRPPLIQHSVAIHIEGDIHRVHMVEENCSVEMSCAQYRRSSWDSSEEIVSDEGDTVTPRSWMSNHLPKPVGDEHDDNCNIWQSATLPSGHNVEDDPLGNDCTNRAHCPTHVSHSTGGSKGKELEPVEGYLTILPAGYGEEDVDIVGPEAKVAGKRKEAARSSMGGTETCLEEIIADPTLGQKMDSIYGHNGPHTLEFENSRAPNVKYFGPETNMGLSRHTTPQDLEVTP